MFFFHYLDVNSDYPALASSDGSRVMAWANSRHRPAVRFDLRPFGSDSLSLPRSGVYVKEPVFAFSMLNTTKTIHNSL